MAQGMARLVVRQIDALFNGGSVAGLSDRQLIERFVNRRDPAGEAAFAALVARHGPMVLGVCREILCDLHQAEDAFQAVFLVLARMAGSIQNPDLLGNWLYGVALRTSRKARVRRARRRKSEEDRSTKHSGSVAAVAAEQPTLAREQAEALHDEIDRLPGAFRLPVVLCYFEGLTLDEAARRLRCPAGTLRSRLARARDKLRGGLARRGVILPATALAAFLDSRFASASVSSPLCDMTTRAAIHFTAGPAAAGSISASAMALAQEVLRSMLVNTLKLSALTCFILGAVAGSAGYWNHTFAMKEEPMRNPAGQESRTEPRNEDRPRLAAKPDPASPGRMIVTGRVLDPADKPAAGVVVDIIGRPRAPEVGTDVSRSPYNLLGHGETDSDGRFRIEASRTSMASFFEVYALAAGTGTSMSWTALNPDAAQPTADVRLRPEQIIRGRLVDVSGQPAAGVEVHIQFYSHGRGESDSIGLPWAALEGIPAWPKPVTTDAQGRFAIAGIGRGYVALRVRDPRFACQRFDVKDNERDERKEVTLALHPATIIEGRAVAADTGRPIPNAVIAVSASFGAFGGMFTTKFRADDQGRFKISPYAGDYFRMGVHPTDGQPYLVRQEEFAWTKGAVKKEIELKLPRGVLIQGKVTEEGTGWPVAAASIQFFPRAPRGDILGGSEAIVTSKGDGSFQVAVPPGKGYLLVLGPNSNYVPKEIGSQMIHWMGQPGGTRHYAHDIIAYEVQPGESTHAITATLKPGKTLRGRLTGPTGESVEQAAILTRLNIDPVNLMWRDTHPLHALDGRFELHGFDPEKATPVYFLDADHQWGASIELSGKQAGNDLTVRLRPCGQARARFVRPDGTPIAKLGMFPYLQLLITPGTHSFFKPDPAEQAKLEADAAFMPNIDPSHYQQPNEPVTDAEGCITLPDLIPGAWYRISDYSTREDQNKGVQIRKDFTVKPGETLDLGDISIERPTT
jgi:RNA polymerase sigma factor (sigma-70 family)